MISNSTICHLDQLSLIKEEWNKIFFANTFTSPFLSFEYVHLWYSCFAKPDQVRIYRVRDGKETIGFLPLIISRKNQIRTLHSLTNDHCLHSDPLVLKGYETVFSKLLLKEIFQDSNCWDIFRFSFSYSFSQIPALLSEDLLKSNGISWQRRTFPTYIISLPKTFDEYFNEHLKTKTRRNLKMDSNRLKRAGSYTFKHFLDKEAIRHWPDFVRVEDSGWKGNSATSIKSLNPNYQQFYDGFLKILAEGKTLHMYSLELNNKNIASAFGYIDGVIFHYAKAGYDEDYKKLSPSNLLIMYVLRNIISHYPSIKIFHLFPWDYNFKHRFTNTPASCLETILFSKSFRGKFMKNSFLMKRVLKQLIKVDT